MTKQAQLLKSVTKLYNECCTAGYGRVQYIVGDVMNTLRLYKKTVEKDIDVAEVIASDYKITISPQFIDAMIINLPGIGINMNEAEENLTLTKSKVTLLYRLVGNMKEIIGLSQISTQMLFASIIYASMCDLLEPDVRRKNLETTYMENTMKVLNLILEYEQFYV